MTDTKTPLELLREPFPENQINKLPKQISANKPGEPPQPKYNCVEGHADFRKASKDGVACGGWHAFSIHLDYVGHAALTDRLLDADPTWTYEFVAADPNGMPLLDANGGLWIRLTVAGVTRPGYGDAQGKKGGNAVKEAIGDALRNAAMRFGAALDLWHKGELHEDEVEPPTVAPKPVSDTDVPPAPPEGWVHAISKIGSLAGLQDYYENDARFWFTPEVQAKFTAHKKLLEAAT